MFPNIRQSAFLVCMQEPENIAAGRAGAGIHLCCTYALAADR